MSREYDKLQKCYESIRERIDFVPQIALVLGSGLGDYANEVQIEAVLDYQEIEGFPKSTVEGHKGRFVFGTINGVKVVIMQGRVHYYEGYDMSDVVLPIRLMKMFGAKVLFLTNAAGGVNYDFEAGDFMIIKNQIACFVPSPLMGENIDKLGTRFPDMSEIYPEKLRDIIKQSAKELGIKVQEGVYVQMTGPNFESPAEVKMCRLLGGDAVGMSTACEAVAANHCGFMVCGISCISNMACGMTEQPLTHKEVQENADRVAPLFKTLVTESITNIAGIF